MFKLSQVFTNYSLKDLADLEFPEDKPHKSSHYDYAKLVTDSIKQMELRVVKSQWAINTSGWLYGCINATNITANKEVQSINDIGVPNSLMYFYTRFSPYSEKFAPSFMGAIVVDKFTDPYLISTGLVGDGKYQALGNFLQDTVEAGIMKSYAGAHKFSDLLKSSKKHKLTRNEALGILCAIFYDNGFPTTKLKFCIEPFNQIYSEKNGDIRLADLFKCAFHAIEEFSVPDQYLFISKATPNILSNLK